MIEKAIHEIFRAIDLPLGLPFERIVTGNVQSENMVLPYATVNVENNSPVFRSNQSRMDGPSVRVQLWIEDHQAGTVARDKLIEELDNQTFTTSEARVTSIRKESDFAIQEEDGIWQFVINFGVMATAI